MHHVYSKLLLLVSLILAIVAVSTKDWLSLSGPGGSAEIALFPKDGLVVPTDVKACQGLAITSVVLLALSLAGSFVTAEYAHTITITAALLGVLLMVACVIVWATKVKKDVEPPGVKVKFGYSFYLAVAAALVGAGASLSLIVESPSGESVPPIPRLVRGPRKTDPVSKHTDPHMRSLDEPYPEFSSTAHPTAKKTYPPLTPEERAEIYG